MTIISNENENSKELTFAEFVEELQQKGGEAKGKNWLDEVVEAEIAELDAEAEAEAKPKKKKKAKKAIEKSRYFCFLLYPESMPENGFELLEHKVGQPLAISPLHDKDIMKVDENGEIIYKKPHWHVIYVANNNVTADSVRKKLQRALGTQAVSMVKICDNVENYYAYLTHESKDAIAKRKHVYSKADITHINNFDISRYIDMSKEAREDIRDNLFRFIMKHKFQNMVMLATYVEENPDCGFTLRTVNDMASSFNGLTRLYLDGVYHESRRIK